MSPINPWPITLKPVLLSAMLALSFFAAVACSDGGDGADPLTLAGEYPIRQSPGLVAQGLTLYGTNCAQCHGTATKPPITTSTPTHSSSGHTWHHPDQFLASWVLDGVPGGITMPRFRGQLTEEEVRAIIAYIKTFWTDTQRQQQQAMSANYEASYR